MKEYCYNATIYHSYKNEAERKALAEFSQVEYTKTACVIAFEVKYRNRVFSVTSSQRNNKQIELCVSGCGNAICFLDTVDIRMQSFQNLMSAMDDLIEKESK